MPFGLSSLGQLFSAAEDIDSEVGPPAVPELQDSDSEVGAAPGEDERLDSESVSEPDEPEEPAPKPRRVGPLSIEKVPKGSYGCCKTCGNRLWPGEWRINYQEKESSNLRDHKRYHVQCCRGWLQKYRDRDLEAVQEHLLTCDPNFEAMWLSVQSALLGTSAASSTG